MEISGETTAPFRSGLGKQKQESSAPGIIGKIGRWKRASYRRLRVVKRLLSPTSSVQYCMTSRFGAPVYVVRRDGSRIQLRGLQTCGNGWSCPVCVVNKSNVRRAELRSAREQHRAAGGELVLLTLTIPHPGPYGADLGRALAALRGSRDALLSGRMAVDLKHWAPHRAVSLEVTHGRNGWHPHLHVLLFLRSGERYTGEAFIAAWLKRLREKWRAAVVRHGFPPPSDAHGVDVRTANDCDTYIAKWGVDEEMSKGHQKRGKNGNRGPWRILDDYADHGDERDGELFVEYAAAFKGRHHLHWSHGAKKHFDLDNVQLDAADDDLADEAVTVAEIPGVLWDYLSKAGLQWDMAAEIDAAVGAEQAVVDRWLEATQRALAAP